MKLNEKGYVRVIDDFCGPEYFKKNDCYEVYKSEDCYGRISYFKSDTYDKFGVNDVIELSDNAKKYTLKIFISDKYVGKMSVMADSVEDAYNTMLETIGHRLYRAFPELEIEYSVQIIEDGDDKE